MSWDVYLMKVPESIVSVHEIYDNFKLLPLGDREDIIAVFKELFPSFDF